MLEYVTKEATRVEGSGFEHGLRPNPTGAVGRLEELVAEVKAGESDREALFDKYGSTYIRTYRGIGHAIELKSKPAPVPDDPRLPKPRHISTLWYYGDTGTGKTARAKLACHEMGLTLFEKKSETKQWWDGYRGEQAILLDDFRGSDMSFHSFLQLTDPFRSPSMKVQVKGGTVDLRATYFFVTSPKHPIETWKCLRKDFNDWRQLQRRLMRIGLCEYWKSEPDFDPETGYTDKTDDEPPEPEIKPTGPIRARPDIVVVE